MSLCYRCEPYSSSKYATDLTSLAFNQNLNNKVRVPADLLRCPAVE